MPCEVVLRPLEVGDAEAYARWMQDAELRELTGSEPLKADDMRRVASAAAADPATAAFLIAVPALAAELPPEYAAGSPIDSSPVDPHPDGGTPAAVQYA